MRIDGEGENKKQKAKVGELIEINTFYSDLTIPQYPFSSSFQLSKVPLASKLEPQYVHLYSKVSINLLQIL